MAEERSLHDAKLKKMEAEMKMVFQQKVNEKESKLKQSEEELYARHREMKDALEKQRKELEEKSGSRAGLSVSSELWKSVLTLTLPPEYRLESGRPLTPPQQKKKGGVFARG